MSSGIIHGVAEDSALVTRLTQASAVPSHEPPASIHPVLHFTRDATITRHIKSDVTDTSFSNGDGDQAYEIGSRQLTSSRTLNQAQRKYTRAEKQAYKQKMVAHSLGDLQRRSTEAPGFIKDVNVPGAPRMPQADREGEAARAQATKVPANSLLGTTKPRTGTARIKEDDARPALSCDAVVDQTVYESVSLRGSSKLEIQPPQVPTSMTNTTNDAKSVDKPKRRNRRKHRNGTYSTDRFGNAP